MQNVSFYNVNYRNSANITYKEIRREVWEDQDVGFTSFFSKKQMDEFLRWLDLKSNMTILDSCCGNGEVLAYVAEETGAISFGIDINSQSIKIAKQLLSVKNASLSFTQSDLRDDLPFSDNSLDAILCIDSIIHFDENERLKIFEEWNRVLKPGAKLIVTDPCVINGVISSEDLMNRSIFGGYFFLPPGTQEILLEKSNLKIVKCQNITKDNAAKITYNWWKARNDRIETLDSTETKTELDYIQSFLKTSAKLYASEKLEQIAWYCQKV
jgi:SAM-dependent methyltransferase